MVRGHCTVLITVNIHYMNSLNEFPQTLAHANKNTCLVLQKSALSQGRSLQQNPQVMKKVVLFSIYILFDTRTSCLTSTCYFEVWLEGPINVTCFKLMTRFQFAYLNCSLNWYQENKSFLSNAVQLALLLLWKALQLRTKCDLLSSR